MKNLIGLVFIATFAITAAAAWKTERKTDEMTDAVSYFIETRGDPVGDAPFVYRPGLLIRVKPSRIERTTRKLTADTGVLFGLGAMDAISFNAKSVLLRFDDSPAENWSIIRANSPEAFFIADDDRFLARLATAKKLKARVDVINTFVTLNFHVADFLSEMELVKDAILKTRPAGIQIYDTPPPASLPTSQSSAPDEPSTNSKPSPPANPPPKPRAVRCRKCRGSGHVELWQKCSSCNGSTRGCDKCRNSGWIGRTKSSAECPQCKGTGQISPPKP